MLLDWEYAHVADPLWDLAGWSANNDLEAQIQWSLLTHYLGKRAELEPMAALQAAALAVRLRLLAVESALPKPAAAKPRDGIAERARLLDARLRLPAHYAA